MASAITNEGDSNEISKDIINIPLEREWVFWHKDANKLKGDKNNWDYGEKICNIDTPGAFWRVYNNIKHPEGPNCLDDSNDYYLFVKGINPKYEDPNNINGGEWRISIKRNKNKRHEELNTYFVHTCLFCIGETLNEDHTIINGVTLNIRKREDRICVWLKTCDKSQIINIGERLRNWNKLSSSISVRFQTFNGNKVILEI